MIRFLAIALFLAILIGPVGDVVVGAVEVGYEAKESNTRLAVATGAEEANRARNNATPGYSRAWQKRRNS